MHSVFSGSQRRVPDITTHQETCWESVCVLLEQAAREIRCHHKNNGLWKSASLGWLTFQVQGLGFAGCYHLNLLVVVAKWYFPCMLVLGFIRLQINSDQGIYSTGCSSSVVIFGPVNLFKINI